MPYEEIARFKAERGHFGPGDVDEHVRERVLDRRERKPNRKERTQPNGRVTLMRRDVLPDGGFVATYTDITERKRAEAALRASEERFKDFAESASDWLWEMGPDLRFTDLSERYFEVTGFRPEDRIGTSRMEYAAPADLDGEAKKWAAHMADLMARKPFKNFEYATTAAADNTTRYSTINGTPIFDAVGNFQATWSPSNQIPCWPTPTTTWPASARSAVTEPPRSGTCEATATWFASADASGPECIAVGTSRPETGHISPDH